MRYSYGSARRAGRAQRVQTRERLVEVRGAVVAEAHLGRQRLDAAVADRLVAAGVRLEVRDARDLEPDDEGRVVRDALRVRLREADADLGREREAVHGANTTIRACRPTPWRRSSASGSPASS